MSVQRLYPETLREFLDRGGRLDGLPLGDLIGLAEAIVFRRDPVMARQLERAAASNRGIGLGLARDGEWDEARWWLWPAEAFEDEDLARRFEAALSPGLLTELLCQLAETAPERGLRLVESRPVIPAESPPPTGAA